MRAGAWLLGLLLLVAAGLAVAQTRDLSGMSGVEIKALQQRLTADSCYQGAIDGQTSETLADAIKACPSQDPILRIETGMHIGWVRSIGVDRACRIAVTGSYDKTVRVWSLPDGRLLRTLRVPIGPETRGSIFTTDISPDGRLIAAGGWDARADAAHFAKIYIFDSATGALMGRVGSFGSPIIHVRFSPDGRWLAATGDAGVGLKVIDTQSWRTIAEDSAYAGDSYDAAFGPNGRLYTVAYDGKVRKYGPGPGFVKEREIRTRAEEPASLSVDPSGQLLAVGYDDSTRVDIYDAATLKFRFAAETKGISRGDLSTIGWSSDGSRLVAGGRYDASFHGKWQHPLFFFGRNGRRLGAPLPLSDDSISDLKPCGNAIAFATTDPAFGLVEHNNQIVLWKSGVEPDTHDDSGDAFTISRNATQVRFGLEGGAKQLILFDLTHATVTNAPPPLPGLLSPLIEGLPVDNWRNNYNPSYAGRPLTLGRGEMARSLAILPDHSGFVLGTAFEIRAYASDGTKRWEVKTPGDTWGVNVSGDGRIIVAAYGDGTIHWLRWSDGKQFLALFVDRKTKTWVAWTPSGYYMASPGGEDLIGWHVNRGWNQAADFFPASRFRDRFNRPDIVRRVLTTLDEGEAIKQANEAARRKADTTPLIDHLPPIIHIADPADGAHVSNDTITLHYAVRSPSGQPVDRLDLIINGRPVKSFGLPIKPLAPNAESTGSVPVTLTQHVSQVGLIAWSEGHASQAVQVQITWDGAPAVTRKLYALVIGVSNYADPAMTLRYAAKDAGDFAAALAAQKGLYYADVQTRVLTDRAVTRASVLLGLQWLEKMATNPNDVTVLFLAGHGMTDAKQTYWFYTSDSNDSNLFINGVSQDELRKSLEDVQGKVLWFLDTCHAGAAAKRPPVDMTMLVNSVSASENGGIVVFASSTGRQVSVESADLGNGAFTKALIEGLDGKAVRPDGLISTSSLDAYLEYRVEHFTADQQTPVMERPPEESDFAIAEIRK